MIYEQVRERHCAETFELKDSDPVRVFPQEVWHKMSHAERRMHFSQKHILLVHDRESGRPHPFPIMSGITDWDEGQIGAYFDIFGYRFMHDQTWYPSGEFPELNKKTESATATEKAKSPTPSSPTENVGSSGEIDDGRFAGSKLWFKGPLPEPSHPDLVEVAELDVKKFPQHSEVLNEWPEPAWLSDGPPIDNSVTPEELRADVNHRLRASQIEELLFNRTRRSQFHDGQLKPAVVNFLDIPMSGCASFAIPIDGLDPFPNLQDHNLPDYTFATQVPHEDFRWALLASAGAISDTHMDAAGFATVVRSLLGKKFWFVGYPDSEDSCHAFCDGSEEAIFFDYVEGNLEEDEVSKKKYPKSKDGRWKRPMFTRRSADGKLVRAYLSIEDGFQDRGLNFFMVVINRGDDL